MICLAFQKPNTLIQNERHLQAKININTKPRLEFNRILFADLSPSVKTDTFIKIQIAEKKKKGIGEESKRCGRRNTDFGGERQDQSLSTLPALSRLWRRISALFLILLLPFRGRRRCMAVGAAPESSERPSATKGKVVRVPAAMVPRKSAAAAVDKGVAACRALAIKRVVEDNGDEDDKETVRDYSLFVMSRGDTIFTRSWTPSKVQVSGRYNDFAKKLNANGFKVYGMDWIGLLVMLRSLTVLQDTVAVIDSTLTCPLDYAVDDMKMFLSKVLTKNPQLPCFCFGHSTSGSIILKAVLHPKVQQHIAGIVVTLPAIGVEPTHPIFLVGACSSSLSLVAKISVQCRK